MQAKNPLDIDSSQVRWNGGTGRHEITIETFNAASDVRRKQVEPSPGKPERIQWDLRVDDPQKGWVVLLTADGDPRLRREVVGSFVAADGLD